MITTPSRVSTGNRQLDITLERMRRAIRTSLQTDNATSLISRNPGGTTVENINRTRRVAIIRMRSPSWSGRVIFHNLRGVTASVSGSPTGFVDFARDSGTVSYCDGSNVNNWPEGHEILAVSDCMTPTHHIY